MRAPRAIDLFSGAGGLTFGLTSVGVDVMGAFEVDKWAADTYAFNFPSVKLYRGDVRQFNNVDIKGQFQSKPDLLVGGPPCQGFSHSNTRHKDPRDPRNSLFIDFLRFVEALRPRICLIENVKGLLTAKTATGEPVIEIIARSFQNVGYSIHFRILDSADFGVPQRRERLFIVAIEGLGSTFTWPEPTHSEVASCPFPLFGLELKHYVTLWEAISDLPQCLYETFDEGQSYRFSPANAYQSLMRAGCSNRIFNHEPMRHTERIRKRFSHLTYGQSEEHAPETLAPKRRGAPDETSTSRYGQNSRRQHPDLPCNTIVASAHTNYIHPYLDRNFTIRESLRIQSFPDTFVMKGKRAVLSKKLSLRKGLINDLFLDQRAQVGNAVPPLLASALLRCLLARINMRSSEAA